MKAKSFYKNNKHNNMDSKEKENINEEELKAQDAQDETCEETTEKEEEVVLTEEEKLAQELEKANAEIEDQKDKYLRLSAEFDNYRKRTMKEKAVELIYNKFMTVLGQNGVKVIETKEQPLDTDYHEAIAVIPAPDEALKGKILDCVQTGYTLNDKVIRHAKVVVGE